MPRKARVKSGSGIYHIMLRGANRQEIFHDDEDCQTFLDLLHKNKLKTNMMIYGWCLMSNHLHLLIREGDEDLSITMKRIGVSFVYCYNQKYGTCGHLFQDRFKSENVENDLYLLTVVRYIHQNPLKAGMVKRVDEWRWSSCQYYYNADKDVMKLLDSEFILGKVSGDHILAKAKFREFNETVNQDQCLEDLGSERKFTDEEARKVIKELLNGIEIAQVKSLPRNERSEILKKTKGVKGLSQRQVARILGVSRTLISKA
ncbi:REP-associated tyrosine transposase [Neobacillus niacini]|uniref:REP-associated tyrosine transposase n=1 Tax=Neobacillus niacini TaxID=86668 RepID=UPI002858E887|nr:transposase [Neobacillus niacini]MDR7002756.1 REP element-mobilizing transposase RayT [Neobacillus niacini]